MNASTTDVETLAQAAYQAFEQGQLAVAESACRRTIAIDRNHSGTLALLGFIQLSASRFGEAVPVFDLLCLLEPKQPTHWMNLGTAYRGVDNLTDSLKAFDRAAQLGARSANFYYNLGLTHIARADFESARAVLDDALKLAPDDDQARYQYVRCCYVFLNDTAAMAV
jgi:Flp pilus assembly protein TadD